MISRKSTYTLFLATLQRLCALSFLEVLELMRIQVLGCIGDLFGGAKAIQDWLTTAARLIARSIPPQRVGEVSKPLITRNKTGKSKTRASRELMTSVVWTTPLGLPVVQPYRKASKKQVRFSL